MSTKTEKPLCPVCFETYTGSVRKECKCPYCSHSCCVKCLQTYFLNSIEDAHCMNCKNKFNKEVLYNFCTKTFVNTTYFKHRQTVLLNRSKSFLPDAQLRVEAEIEFEKLKKILDYFRQKRRQIYHETKNKTQSREAEISLLKKDMKKNKNE